MYLEAAIIFLNDKLLQTFMYIFHQKHFEITARFVHMIFYLHNIQYYASVFTQNYENGVI